MEEKFQNKYRIPSARLQNWDYGSNGAYFITICTKNREHFFGEIVKTNYNASQNEPCIMHLNEIGKLAEQFWLKIPQHFPFVELGNFVIMPNHTHGIIIINKKYVDEYNATSFGATVSSGATVSLDATVETLQCNVSTCNAKNQTMANISPKPGTISTIIRSYKSIVSKHARYIHADFEWQPRFHDHIIRNAKAFENIQHYIANNPLNWKEDTFYGSY